MFKAFSTTSAGVAAVESYQNRASVFSLFSVLLLAGIFFAFFLHLPGVVKLSSPVSVVETVQNASLPIYFVPNKGQYDDSVHFHAVGSQMNFYLGDSGVTYVLGGAGGTTLNIDFVGSLNSPAFGLAPQNAEFNYLYGNDKTQWETALPSFGAAIYKDLYPGIDLVYSGAGNVVKYEYRVSPGADPSAIQMRYRGIESLSLNKNGDLLVKTSGATLVDHRPIVYQMINGVRVPVDASFGLVGSTVAFQIGQYLSSLPLIIDPGLEYSTFLGAGSDDNARAIIVDDDGNTYVAGDTASSAFPTPNGYDTTHSSGYDDAFVVKLNPAGTALVYGTFLGGSNHDGATDIALGSDGSVYVTGFTKSTNFPTPNGYRTTFSGGFNDAFAAKLGPQGNTLEYGTYLGGAFADIGNGIDVDSSGNAYIAGETTSTSFPLSNAGNPSATGYDTGFNGGGNDAFVVKLGATGDNVLYRTYLGGSLVETANAVVVNSSGQAFVAGETSSSNFPTASAYDSSFNNGYDAFVTKLNASGTALLYSTFIGGSGSDIAEDVEIDSSGGAYITGTTASTNFPTPGGYDQSNNGFDDAFIASLSPSGSTLSYGSYIGGSGADGAKDLSLDSVRSVYITGTTSSSNFQTKAAYDTSLGGYKDAFIAEFAPGGGSLGFSTYFGGSSLDSGFAIDVSGAGVIHTAGESLSSDLPVVNGFDQTYSSAVDSYIARFSFPDTSNPNTTITSGPSGIILTADALFEWTGNDDTTSSQDLVYSYTLVGYDTGWSTYSSATSAVYTGLPNGTYTFKVKAKDLAGNEDQSPAQSQFSVAVSGGGSVTHEETDPNIVYSAGCWNNYTNPLLSGGNAKISNKKPCSATFTFVGSQIDFISAKAKQTGKAKIYLDGVFQSNVDLYSNATTAQYVAYTAAALTLTSHIIKVEVLGTKNAAATGYYVPIDAFQVTS